MRLRNIGPHVEFHSRTKCVIICGFHLHVELLTSLSGGALSVITSLLCPVHYHYEFYETNIVFKSLLCILPKDINPQSDFFYLKLLSSLCFILTRNIYTYIYTFVLGKNTNNTSYFVLNVALYYLYI